MKPSTALFLATALTAQAEIVILPRAATVLEGRTCAFHLALATGERVPAADWRWTLESGPGSVDPDTGVYTAPPVAQPCTVKLRATYQPFATLSAEAALLVLPHQPFDIVDKVLGPGWVQPLPAPFPFLDPATGQRPPHGRGSLWNTGTRTCRTGYGLPLTLTWTPQPWAQATLLSYGRGPEQVQVDVSGQRQQVIPATGALRDYTVEAMRRRPEGGTWQGVIQRGSIQVRGLLPHAGNAVAAPGHEDGWGPEARFQEPFGMASFVGTDARGLPGFGCLVSDPGSHVIRRVSQDGQVSTLAGHPHLAGHLDSTPASWLRSWAQRLCPRALLEDLDPLSLFRGPTFLLITRPSTDPRSLTWICRVADSGNHVIREVHPDGRVTTLAGTPGVPGHRDSWFGSWAQFHDPQGLAEDLDGTIYVADRGNCVIRSISPTGAVGTLAGSPGEPGDRDGLKSEARFSQLRGLVIPRQGYWAWQLYAVDGHAIRRITLPEGQVNTVVGVVADPGFREVQGGSAGERRQALRQPCLRAPCGLLGTPSGLLIADQGNHAVREWDMRGDTLTTLAGDPALGATRWGLARDGLASPLDGRYAALASPCTLADIQAADHPGFLVTTGACLGELQTSHEGLARLEDPALDCPGAQAGEACVIRCATAARSSSGTPVALPLYCVAEFLEADGTLAETVKVEGVTGTPLSFQGTLQQRGQGRVRIRCVTGEGVSAGASAALVVR